MKLPSILTAVVILVVTVLVFLYSLSGKKVENNIILASPTPQATADAREREATKSTMKKSYDKLPPVIAKEQIKGKTARIKTTYGDIIFELFDDAPITSSNFIFLANDKFYDGLTFHRREEGFVIQGGDPNGDGTGGPGYKFIDEVVTRDYKRGIVAMANSGPNTNGSQFFIMLADNPLPKQYTIFGNVVEGMSVVDKIQVGDAMEVVTIE